METEQLAELRTWALVLRQDARPDVRAAAKAILLLADEIERMRTRPPAAEPAEPVEPAEAPPESEGDSAFRQRLGRLARHR